MGNSCVAILWASRSGLSDRTSPTKAELGSIGSGLVPRVGHASASIFVQFCFFASLGL